MEKTGSASASKRWAMLGAAGLIIPEAFNKYGANCGPEAVWFKVLSLHETIASYGSIYYIGTAVQVVLILLGIVIKLGKPVRSKARRE
ncbi:unnamed protein product [Lupinus luteus]|uniref:Uncharacterized protein n=1 Tax=Lupinus luteus TaxID=3873 RepID=A0AAV1WNH5_LUPLU